VSHHISFRFLSFIHSSQLLIKLMMTSLKKKEATHHSLISHKEEAKVIQINGPFLPSFLTLFCPSSSAVAAVLFFLSFSCPVS